MDQQTNISKSKKNSHPATSREIKFLDSKTKYAITKMS